MREEAEKLIEKKKGEKGNRNEKRECLVKD